MRQIMVSKSVEIYQQGDFEIEIWHDGGNFEAWLTREGYGVSELMFGMPKAQQSIEAFRGMVEANLDEYMAIYDERYGEV